MCRWPSSGLDPQWFDLKVFWVVFPREKEETEPFWLLVFCKKEETEGLSTGSP